VLHLLQLRGIICAEEDFFVSFFNPKYLVMGTVPAGFIAFQVHGVGRNTKTLEVRFRNARVKEL